MKDDSMEDVCPICGSELPEDDSDAIEHMEACERMEDANFSVAGDEG